MAVKRLRIDEIEIIAEMYPRRRHQDRIVAQYRAALDLLPPITVAKRNGKHVLIDGYHRLLAHRLENREEISAEVIQCKDILLEAIRRNAAHGYQLEDSDKATCARLLYQRTDKPIRDEAKLQAILGVSGRAVRGYLGEIKRKEKDARDARIRELWFDCYSHEEIAGQVGIDDAQAGRILEALPECENEPPASLQTWTLWEEWQDCADQYGADHPGRMPGQVIENLLYYLTAAGDAVLDPMAGSGTTRDVCQAMGRRCFSSDMAPFPGKDFIRKHMISEDGCLPAVPGTVKRQGGFALIVLDPPYWRQADYGKRGMGASGAFASYCEKTTALIQQAVKTCRPGGYVAAIVSMTMADGAVYHPLPDWHQAAIASGATLWDWIIVPYTRQRATGPQVAAAQKAKRLLRLHRDLVIWQAPTKT